MKKIILFVLSTALMSIILIGCQSEENTTSEANLESQLKETDKLNLDGKITKVSICKSKGIDSLNFEEEQTLKTIRSIFLSALKEEGIVNMTNPEFYLDIFFEDQTKQSFHLWIGEKGEKSTLMKVETDTHTIYSVSTEMTDKLIDLVE